MAQRYTHLIYGWGVMACGLLIAPERASLLCLSIRLCSAEIHNSRYDYQIRRLLYQARRILDQEPSIKYGLRVSQEFLRRRVAIARIMKKMRKAKEPHGHEAFPDGIITYRRIALILSKTLLIKYSPSSFQNMYSIIKMGVGTGCISEVRG